MPDNKLWVSRTYPKQKRDDPKEAKFYEEEWFPNLQKEVPEGQVLRLPVQEPCARVSVSMGMTINLGDFQSARVDAGITLPCEVGEVKDAYKMAWDVVEKELRRHIREAREEKNGR